MRTKAIPIASLRLPPCIAGGVLIAALTALCGCGDEPLPSTTPGTAADSTGSDLAFSGRDTTSGADTADHANADSGTAPVSDALSVSDSGSAASSDSGSIASDTATWQAPDINHGPLQVIATSPKHNALGADPLLQFELTFSTDVLDAAIQPYTVLVSDPTGKTIDGDFKVKGPKVSFKATKAAPLASRIDVVVTTFVQGTFGQTMNGPFKFAFHTRGYKGTAPYLELARRYAPLVRAGVKDKTASWTASDGLDFTGPGDKPSLGYSVATTPSHTFIHYVYRWPTRAAVAGKPGFVPDLAGATVVVTHHPKRRPAGLFTWFKTGDDEQWWGWLTSEGGLVPPGANAKKANVRAILKQDALFAESADDVGCKGKTGCVPRRATTFVTGGTHQSCLWSDFGDTLAKQCETHKGAKLAMKLVRYVPFGKGSLPATPKAPTKKLADVRYELIPVDDVLWPRRNDPSLFGTPITWMYKPQAGRPAGMKAPLGTKFTSKTADFGRPPWAWRWKPKTNVTYYDMPRGTLFLDPAWAIYQRMGGATAKIPAWNASKKTGYALTYCFAPALYIDKRTTPGCKDALPP